MVYVCSAREIEIGCMYFEQRVENLLCLDVIRRECKLRRSGW